MAGTKYMWPASGLGRGEMKLLHLARESAAGRTSITRLIAEAVRQAYGSSPPTRLPAGESEAA